MRHRLVLSLGAGFVLACGSSSEPNPTPADIAGTWVLTFPSLFVPGNGFQCTSLSGTVLQVEQDGEQVVAPYDQGLLICATNPFDSTAVFFTQGRILGTIQGSRLELRFDGAEGTFTGRVDRDSAWGKIDYRDATYGVMVSGSWKARHRTPTGALDITFSTGSISGLPLPPVLFTLDGDTTIQAPQNGTLPLTGLTGGRHHLRVTNGEARSCSVVGGPSGSMGGINPNDQFVDVVEGDPRRTIAYFVTCA